MERYISVIIPNYNMAATIGLCLEAAFASDYKNYEVVVVDDHSDDGSPDIIKKYPCRLIRLEHRAGTSRARNTGALNSRGEVLFFTDADCLLERDTLSIINKTVSLADADAVIGGTYSRMPYDRTFFSIFQSVFVNYSETKHVRNPDYIAAHAMIINRETFRRHGGFPEDFLPIIEDVEFSHRLRREGCRLLMNPEIQVRHIFNFSLMKSLRNGVKKTAYWNMYSLKNNDMFKDSGSASVELKTNVVTYFASIILTLLFLWHGNPGFLYPVPVLSLINIFLNRLLFRAFGETGGGLFGGMAFLYYTMIYPVPVGIGTFAGIAKYFAGRFR